MIPLNWLKLEFPGQWKIYTHSQGAHNIAREWKKILELNSAMVKLSISRKVLADAIFVRPDDLL